MRKIKFTKMRNDLSLLKKKREQGKKERRRKQEMEINR